jgi:hypothetical protein
VPSRSRRLKLLKRNLLPRRRKTKRRTLRRTSRPLRLKLREVRISLKLNCPSVKNELTLMFL